MPGITMGVNMLGSNLLVKGSWRELVTLDNMTYMSPGQKA
jgi:hypothetical protein